MQFDFYKILLIEDNTADARIFQLLLSESEGVSCEIIHKETLASGMEALEKEEFDATFLDLILPDSRGFETLQTLISRFPDANIIVLTGLSDRQGIEMVRAGAQDFIVKGDFNSNTLVKSLRYSVERRQALKRLAEAQRIAHIGNWEFRTDSKEIIASDEVYRILGYAPREIPINEHTISDANTQLHIFKEIHDEVLTTGHCKREFIINRKDGQIRYILTECQPIFNKKNTIVSLSGIIQDSTERKQTEELRKAQENAKMKEQFLAQVSHDMRTPMNVIIGFSNLVLDSKLLHPNLRKEVEAIQNHSQHLLGIINDILEIQSIENGKVEFQNKPFDLYQELQSLFNIVQYKLPEKQLGFELSIEENVPRFISGDQQRLTQILNNLAGNAVKFTEEGEISISVKCLHETEDTIHLQFSVADTGRGIPEDKLDAIFQTFTRVEYKDKKYEGTGLGLSIVKNLVERQGGKISVQSQVNVGSTFIFDLNFNKSSADLATPNNNQQIYQLDENNTYHVLLVDDHPGNRIVGQRTIERYYPNVQVALAEDGQLALEKLAIQRFDLILMDLQMPVLDGYETTEKIRNNQNSQIANTPILAMTADVQIAKDDKFLNYKMDGYITKPFNKEELLWKIAKFISHQSKLSNAYPI